MEEKTLVANSNDHHFSTIRSLIESYSNFFSSPVYLYIILKIYMTIISVGGSTTECFYISDDKTRTHILGMKLILGRIRDYKMSFVRLMKNGEN